MKKLLLGSSVLLAGLLLGNAGLAQDASEDMVRDLAVVQRPLYDMSLSAGQIRVTARTEKPANSYVVGDDVRFVINSAESAYITVINVGTSGKTTVLFPNAANPFNRVRAGQTITLPAPGSRWGIQAQGPAGIEVIKVIASSSPRPLTAGGKFKADGIYKSYDGDSDDAVRDLGVVMQPAPKVRQGSATLLFRVSER